MFLFFDQLGIVAEFNLCRKDIDWLMDLCKILKDLPSLILIFKDFAVKNWRTR
jgi:hypothetical protein